MAVWYRRPEPGEVASIKSLEPELHKFAPDTVGTIILGDLNVHEPAWLRYSAGSTVEGRELHGFCSERGLQQHVREPTRGDYLLDLVISDVGPLIRTKVVPGIADHSGVLCTMSCPVPVAVAVQREVLLFGRAKWKELRQAIENHDWSSDIVEGDADGSAVRFEERLLYFIHRFIPRKLISDEKSSHRWLDDNCRKLIREKREAWGTESFVDKRDACTNGLLEAYNAFIKRTLAKLSNLKPSSREWWKISRSLMSLGSSAETIPPLKDKHSNWVTTAPEKANLLADIFLEKSRLDDEVVNDFSEVVASTGEVQGGGFLPIRRRYVRRVLKQLDAHSGTGPDGISARVLRECRGALELPVLLLTRVIFNQGRWPTSWRTHWIHPLYKKKSRADGNNYRGVHLTPQISKVVERVVGCVFLPWANRVGLFGENQYAYSTRRSHRDALAVNICNWLRSLDNGCAVGLYCSDVSGAFDRVRCDRLVEKLEVSGLHRNVVRLLASWLEDRESSVVVCGAKSDPTELANSVFQGTVLGPPLWNIFYADAALATRLLRFIEVVFADDYNCWKPFSRNTDRPEILRQCEACQARLHEWGAANSVKFDPDKESFHVLHRSHGFGDEFKLLGLTFDVSLRMERGVSILAREAGWRLQSVLRPQRFFTEKQIVNLYKSQVLSYIESSVPGYYHAASTTLHTLDRIQDRLCRALSLSPEVVLERYRLAPLKSRRDMALMGLLHRVVLSDVSRQLAELFPFATSGPLEFVRTRLQIRRHNKQLIAPPFGTETLRRSLFGLVRIYNLLPQSVVDLKSVKEFQSTLQGALRHAASLGIPNWDSLFSPRLRPVRDLEFQRHFEG